MGSQHPLDCGDGCSRSEWHFASSSYPFSPLVLLPCKLFAPLTLAQCWPPEEPHLWHLFYTLCLSFHFTGQHLCLGFTPGEGQDDPPRPVPAQRPRPRCRELGLSEAGE